MPSATYVLEVDWANDGFAGGGRYFAARHFSARHFSARYFGGAGGGGGIDDISAYVISLSYSRGRDYASQLTGRASAGQLEAELINTDGRFSSFLTTGPLYGNLVPARKVRLRTTSPAAYTLWSGVVDSIEPLPAHGGINTAKLHAVGPLVWLTEHTVEVAMQTNILTGAAIGLVLDECDWPTADRTLDTGQTTMNRWWKDEVTCLFAAVQVADTDPGYLGESADGKIVFEDRLHRLITPHTTSQATFTDAAGAGLLRYDGIRQLNPLADIYNVIEAKVQLYTTGALAVLWTLAETAASSPAIQAGESRSYWAAYPNADSATNAVSVDAWTTPVATTDYLANSQADGLGTNLTASVSVATSKFSNSMKITLTNAAAVTAYITFLQARGTPITADDPVKVVSEDATSQAAYGRRSYENQSPFLPSTVIAQNWCDLTRSIFKDPIPILTIDMLANRSSDQLTEVLTLDVSDRITLVATGTETLLGINEEFFIEAMRHSVSRDGLHRVSYDISPAAGYSGFWVLGSSLFGTTTKLMF